MEDTFWGHKEVFWVGVQALTAIAGMLGLFAYVLDTRRMRQIQTDMRRASFTPVLGVASQQVTQATYYPTNSQGERLRDAANAWIVAPLANHYDLSLEITNIGQGPATGVRAWVVEVSDGFELQGNDLYPSTPQALIAKKAAMQIGRDQTQIYQWSPISAEKAALFVIE